MHKKLRTINNVPMTKIIPPMDNYISCQNTIEKNEDLWVHSSSLGGLLSSLMEISSYNGRKMENGEENQCIFPQEVSGMAYCNDA
jgi:hypothetical protein